MTKIKKNGSNITFLNRSVSDAALANAGLVLSSKELENIVEMGGSREK